MLIRVIAKSAENSTFTFLTGIAMEKKRKEEKTNKIRYIRKTKIIVHIGIYSYIYLGIFFINE